MSSRFSPTSGVDKPWLIATALWILAVGVFTWANARMGTHHTICPLKNLLNIPCPGCGGTRATLALAQGRFAEAFAFNPLTSAVLLLSPVLLFVWLRRRNTPPADRWRPGRLFWMLTILLVLANWLVVLRNLPRLPS